MVLAKTQKSVILVVEDEGISRIDTVELIKQAGFTVFAAADADEAIRILENRSDVSVIITDIIIPGSMDGIRLAHAVHGRWPPIRIIATSGDFTWDQDSLPEGGMFLAKPYSPGQMICAMRAVGVDVS